MKTTVMTLNAINRGWFAETGAHSALQQNTATGLAGDLGILRTFLVFDLSVVTVPVQRATLRLELEAYLSGGDAETFVVGCVKVPARSMGISYLPGAAAGQAIFEQLGAGAVYGQATIAASDVGRLIEIALSPQAIIDIQAAAGNLFAVGIWLNDINQEAHDTLRMIRFSSAAEARTHQLVLETQATVQAQPTDEGAFGLLYDVPGTDVSEALREVVAKQASMLESMLQSLLNAMVHVQEHDSLEDNEKAFYLNRLIQETTKQLGGFATNHVHVERRIGDVLAGYTSVVLSHNCLALLHDLEQVNTVLHTNVSVVRRYLEIMRAKFSPRDEADDETWGSDSFDR